MTVHPELSSGRWFKMPLALQLGNVGGEYERAANWLEKHDQTHFNSAFQRFLELLDLTINDPRWSVFRKKELLRLREISCGQFSDETKDFDLKKYFYNFALLARRGK